MQSEINSLKNKLKIVELSKNGISLETLSKKYKIMPVQINEMVIRANIVEPLHNAVKHVHSSVANMQVSDKEAFMKECVEKVLEIINQKYQR